MPFDASELINGTANRNHNLNRDAAGNARMFYVGEMPWHQLGTRLDRPATAAEAIEAAGMGFTVKTVPVRTSLPDEANVHDLAVPGAFAVVREDTREALGMVGPAWKPVQNADAFSFLDRIAADGGIEYHTAGVLGRGEKIWVLAKLPGALRVAGTDDEVERFLLLSNNHDGRGAVRGLWTPQRVVCQNTLAVALAGGEGTGITIRHTGNLDGKVREAQRVLGLAERFYDELMPQINALAAYRPTVAQIGTYFRSLYPDPERPEVQKVAASTAGKVRDVLTELFEGGIGHDMPGVRGSAWAAYNAVTEYIDHQKPVRVADRQSHTGLSKKLESMWFGDGAKVKRDAWVLASEMALVG